MLAIATLLLASTLHAGPERPVSRPVVDSQPYGQVLNAAAGDGDEALVIWDEGALRAVRVDRDGTTLDASPLLIAPSAYRGSASAARGVNGWQVVWTEQDTLLGRSVAEDGTLGGRTVIAIGRVAFPLAKVAFDGTQFLAVWHDSPRLMAARLSAAGEVLETPFVVSEGWSSAEVTALLPARDGGFVLIAWSETAVHALRLNDRGRRIGSEYLPIPPDASSVAAAVDPDGALVVAWATSAGLWLRRGNEAPVKLAGGGTIVRDVVLAGGTAYVHFEHDEDVVLASVLGERRWDLNGKIETARAVSLGDRILLAMTVAPWLGWPDLEDVYVAVVDSSLDEIESPRLIVTEPRLQVHPAVASAGGTTLTAWIELTGPQQRARIMAKLDGRSPFLVAEDARAKWLRIASDGNDFVLLWTYDGLYTAHVTRAGAAVPIPVRKISRSAWLGPSCVTWTGTEYVVGFIKRVDWTPGALKDEIFAQRLSREGDPMFDAFRIASGAGGVACASTAETTLFVAGTLEAATRTRAGTISAPFTIGSGEDAAVASNGTNFLVAWYDRYSSHPIETIGRATVTESGTVTPKPAIPVEPVPDGLETPAVAARANGYVLLFGMSPLRALPVDEDGDDDGAEIAIAMNAANPAAAGGVIVYQRDTASLNQARWRVFTRTLSESRRRRAMRQ